MHTCSNGTGIQSANTDEDAGPLSSSHRVSTPTCSNDAGNHFSGINVDGNTDMASHSEELNGSTHRVSNSACSNDAGNHFSDINVEDNTGSEELSGLVVQARNGESVPLLESEPVIETDDERMDVLKDGDNLFLVEDVVFQYNSLLQIIRSWGCW
ncbi:hypothetical protein V6N13_127062 [Hibiscus sabdariffa]